jgi:cobalt/nickel transport system permease protein
MVDALLSPAVGAAMCAVSTVANVYAVKRIKKDDLCEKKIPVMGVMGAFVFAAQMINFTIPATGSSGHIGGGILLTAMIGGLPALLSISAVLIIQCLFFADGGLLALGCNIFNIGVIPCLIVYPLIFSPLVKKCMTSGKITAASVVAVVISLQLGAFSVVLETQLSGVTALPFSTFLFLMQPIHLAIGFAEGIITAAVLCFIYKIRPEIMESTYSKTAIKKFVPMRNILITLVVATMLIGGVLSIFASSYPDGLEWAIEKTAGTNFKGISEGGSEIGTATSGIAGGAFTFLLAGVVAFVISVVKKKRRNIAPA